MKRLSRLCLMVAFALAAIGMVTAPITAEARTRHAKSHKSAHAHAKTHKPRLAVLGTSPKYASMIMDAASGQILQSTDPDKLVHPASLTKMMTLLVVFQALKDGDITLHDNVPVSAHAHAQMPSKLDIPAGSTIRLDNAILAVVTHSSNDIAMALAEHVGRTEGTFVSMMNRDALALGMSHTHFENPNGLHHPKQVTTARDMAILGRALIYNYPQYYRYFSTPSFTYGGHVYANHNHLMATYKGMDGIKTGFIVPSGFNLVASVKRGDRRLIGVVFGGQSASWRDQRMASLLNAAFAQAAPVRVAAAPARAAVSPAVPQDSAPAQAQASVPPDGEGDTDSDGTAVPAAARPATPPPIALNPATLNPAGPATPPAGINPAAGAAPAQLASINPVSPAPPPPAAGGTPDITHAWGVQIGTYSSQAKAGDALRATFNALPAELRHVTGNISPLQTADGPIYRSRLNGFTHAEAVTVCSRLPNCLPVSPYANN